MVRLALHTMRLRAGGFVASFVALFFGGVIVMSCGALMATGIDGAVPPQRLAGAPIVVTAPQGHAELGRLDVGLVDVVRAVPGVAAAVPDVSFPAVPLRDGRPVRADAVGHGWASAGLTPYTVTAGTAPGSTGEVVLDSALASAAGVTVGDQLDLAVGDGSERFRVVGLADVIRPVGQPGRDDGATAVFFSEQDARRLAGPEQVDAIGVRVASGTDTGAVRDRVEAALAGRDVSVLTGDDRGLAEFSGTAEGTATLIALAAVFGGLAATVAVFVVASTLALSVQQRHREMALLRAIGATPGQVRRMVLAEAAVVAVLASVLAWRPSGTAGAWLFDRLAGAGVVSDAVAYRAGWVPVAAGAGIALLTALGAAHLAGRGAARARPTDALREATLRVSWLSWQRVVFALLCLGGALALTIVTATVMSGPVAASTAGPMAMLWASGLALLGPGVARLLTAVLRWPVRAAFGQAGHLAVHNAAARRVRAAGAVSPIMLATGLATALLYMQTAQTRAAEEAFTGNLHADAVLTSDVGGFPADFVTTVAATPGVTAASAAVPSSGRLVSPDPEEDDSDTVPVIGVTASGAQATFTARVTEGSLSDLSGRTIALPAALGQHVGDTVAFQLGDGVETELRVVALFTTDPGYETVLLPDVLVADHTTARLVPTILVRADPDATARLADLALRRPGLRVAAEDELAGGAVHREQTGAWVNYLLIAMILGYAVISLVNTLVVATGERRGEFALQRLVGATRGQVMRMVLAEAVLTTASGVVLGTAVALVTLAAFGMALTGSPWPDGPLWIYGAVVGVVAVLTVATSLLVTWLVLRSRPVEVVGRMP